jgi:hypothetical protein
MPGGTRSQQLRNRLIQQNRLIDDGEKDRQAEIMKRMIAECRLVYFYAKRCGLTPLSAKIKPLPYWIELTKLKPEIEAPQFNFVKWKPELKRVVTPDPALAEWLSRRAAEKANVAK